MKEIKHIDGIDGLLPNVVKTVNEIIDVLPSLEVYGDNITTMVSHHAFGTTVKAARGSNGGGVPTTTVVSTLIETPLPYQWDVALSSSLSDYLIENPSAQLSAMTADEILSFPYNISFKRVPNSLSLSQIDCIYDDVKQTYSFRNGQVLLSGITGANNIILSTHYITQGSTKRAELKLEPISGHIAGLELYGSSHIDLGYVTATSGNFPIYVNINGKTLVKLKDEFQTKTGDWLVTRPSYEQIDVTMGTRQDRAGRVWIFNREYYLPSASFTYDDICSLSGVNTWVGIYAHVKYVSSTNYTGNIDLSPTSDDADVFYTREIAAVRCIDYSGNSATSGYWPQRYIDVGWNDRNVPIDLRGFWVRW